MREKLDEHLRARPMELKKMQKDGVKVIGVAPGGYMPEELVHACGAVSTSVGLVRGGEPEPILHSGAYIPRWIDTFCRAQIGYKELNEDPLYEIIDLLVVPITDQNIRAMADCFDFYTDIPVFRYGVPHVKKDYALRYYTDGLYLLKEKLEEVTSSKIDYSKLHSSIEVFNRERELLNEISSLRKEANPPISGKEFIRLNHASFLAEKTFMVEMLERILDELRKKSPGTTKGPRILLTGSTIAIGDYKILDILETCGAQVVIEEFTEGMRHYSELVEPGDDIFDALADRYFQRRIGGAYFRPGKERLEYIIKLAKEFRVDGVVWYTLMYRDSWDFEEYYFSDILKKETGLPMLTLRSDYDSSEIALIRTRIETFIETIKRGVNESKGGKI